jgi:hypothetical protein
MARDTKRIDVARRRPRYRRLTDSPLSARLTHVSEFAGGGLARAGARGTIGAMLARFSRILILLAVAAVVYAGPVAACVCAAELAPEMSCCPDDAQQQDRSDCMQSDSAASAVCDPVPADLLAAGMPDLSPPIAIAAAPPPWSVHGPPPAALATSPPPHDSPPVYLVTLRLRI